MSSLSRPEAVPEARVRNGALRVLHLIDHMGVGGAQRVVLDLVESRAPTVEVAVSSLRSHLLPELEIRLQEAGVPYYGLGLTRINPFGIHRLRRLIATWRPQIVHSHLEVSNTLAVIAVWGMGDDRPRLINHLHNDPFEQYSYLHRLSGRVLASRVDLHLAPSETVAKAMSKAFGGHHCRAAVSPYGIDPAWLARGSTERTAALRGDSRYVGGTVGRLVPQKSTSTLLRATPTLLRFEPSTRVLILGDGPRRSELENEARTLGIEDHVTFLGYSDDLQSIYSAMDVFVLPSKYEGFPISLLEVMAMGTPIVATDVVGITDVISDGFNGLLVPFDDPQELSSAIERAISTEPLRRVLSENAREFVRQGFTRDRVTARVESLYEEICEISPKGL